MSETANFRVLCSVSLCAPLQIDVFSFELWLRGLKGVYFLFEYFYFLNSLILFIYHIL